MTEIIVEGYHLDLSGSETVPINIQALDIKDVDKRISDFTKTIRVPGSKKNNEIFGHVFNLQKEHETSALPNIKANYNPKRKARAILQKNGMALSEGYIQLRNIRKNSGRVSYEIVFYGQLSDIVSEIAGKKVSDLTLTDLNHTISFDEVTGSWLGDGDYIYPFIDYGHGNIRSHGIVELRHLKPAVKLKRYIDAIFDDTKFEYICPFFESDEFNRFYIPYNGTHNNTITEQEIERLTSVSTNDKPEGIQTRFPEDGDDVYYRGEEQYNLNDDILGTDHINTELVLPDEVLFQYVAPETRVYNLEFTAQVALEAMYEGTQDEEPGEPFDMREHRFAISIQVFNENGDEVFPQLDSGNRTVITDLWDEEVVFSTGSSGMTYFNLSGDPDDNERRAKFSRSMTSPTTLKEYELAMSFTEIELQEGYRIKVNYEYYADFNDWGKAFFEDGTDDDPRARITRANTSGVTWSTDPAVDKALAWVRLGAESFLEVSPIKTQMQSDYIHFSKFILTEVDQKDLFLSTLKLFNLVAVPDGRNPNYILIKKRDEFFNEGQTKNWDNKEDLSRNQEIQPVRDPNVKRWVYSWSEGQDYYSNQYREITDREYGDLKVLNNSELGEEDKDNINIIFEPAVVVQYEDRNVLDLYVEFPTPTNKARIRVENSDELEELTGIGQQITVVVQGRSHTRTIKDIQGSNILVDSPIEEAKKDNFYGCVLKNRYDRLSIPCYKGKDDNIGQEPTETNPKLFYYSGTKACNNYSLTTSVSSEDQFEYPILHHLNAHPDDNPTFDYNFGRPQRVFFDISDYPEDNLFTEHHQQTIEEILDGSNIIKGYFNLSYFDVVNLEYNDRIWIDGIEYRFNRLIDYNINSEGLVQVELIRL